MFVCAHGDVTEYCEAHDMLVCEVWRGELTAYNGICPVIVTDADISEAEYYLYKGEMLGKGYELISTRYTDNKLMAGYLTQARMKKRRVKKSSLDAEIIQKIQELRAEGLTIREIQNHESIVGPNGEKFSLSTILKYTKSKGEEE